MAADSLPQANSGRGAPALLRTAHSPFVIRWRAAGDLDGDTRRRTLFEIVVVICIAVLPDIWHALSPRLWLSPDDGYEYVGASGAPLGVDHAYIALSSIDIVVRSIAVLTVVFYLMWRSGEPWSQFGFVRFRWAADLCLGVLLWLAAYAVRYAFWIGVTALSVDHYCYLWGDIAYATYIQDAPGLDGFTTVDSFWIVVSALANGPAEEIALFAFLFTRLERLGGTRLALCVVPLLFASYHIYYATGTVVVIYLFGLLHAGAFILLRRIWPLIVAHILANGATVVWAVMSNG